jgi:hypothetical protein
VEVDPLAGDEAAVDLVGEESGAGCADVLAGGEGEGVQGVGLGLVEVLPDLGEEVKEGQEEGVEGVEPAVEAAWGGDVGEEVQVFGEGQGFVVLTTEFHGGEYGEGKDDAGGNLGLGVVLVAHRLKGVVYDTKGRYGVRKHSGLYFFWPRG